MKTTLLLSLFLGLVITPMTAQSFNQELKTEGKSPVLLGKVNRYGFSTESFPWFTKNLDAYIPNSEAIDSLKQHLHKYTITAFMGTWCGDSKREVPKLYKVLEAANFPLDRLTMVAVSRECGTYKQSPGGEEEGMYIHRVPTFIIYKNGREVNRIVESPVESLEEDLVKIIEKDYTPKYYGVQLVQELLTSTELESRRFQKKQKKLLPKLKSEIKNWRELNTLSYLLFNKHEQEKALAVGYLNTLLFPEEADAHTSLANKLYLSGKLGEAQSSFEQALALDPEHKKAKSGLAQMKDL